MTKIRSVNLSKQISIVCEDGISYQIFKEMYCILIRGIPSMRSVHFKVNIFTSKIKIFDRCK